MQNSITFTLKLCPSDSSEPSAQRRWAQPQLPGAAMACNAMCTTSYSSSEFELQSTIAYFFKKLSDSAGNFSTSGYYFNSNLLFFHIKKHIHMCVYIYVCSFPRLENIFSAKRRDSASSSRTPLIHVKPIHHLHFFMYILVSREITSLVEQSHSTIRWSCFLIVWLQLKHLFVFGKSCFLLWDI